ncbi:hypothetical protein ACFW4X_00285 [Streptomyces smyrnaeus]|uniref:Secreted protein n=1 Tax=Streptomyces smyrnaeus TaxID=1387713 RepID=A0ABS3Y401_9ACTN|nr:hypothetical protein [Streptomyces smyrnaeus]MBO8202400.1 hypothetical protein [Streptomyces smyrnaeus]
MKRCARAAAVVGLTVALGGLSAPAAMADVTLINKAGPTIHESGPGDLGYTNVEDSYGVKTSQLDKSVRAGDIITKILGKVGQATVTNEVEGAEQDQGENA